MHERLQLHRHADKLLALKRRLFQIVRLCRCLLQLGAVALARRLCGVRFALSVGTPLRQLDQLLLGLGQREQRGVVIGAAAAVLKVVSARFAIAATTVAVAIAVGMRAPPACVVWRRVAVPRCAAAARIWAAVAGECCIPPAAAAVPDASASANVRATDLLLCNFTWDCTRRVGGGSSGGGGTAQLAHSAHQLTTPGAFEAPPATRLQAALARAATCEALRLRPSLLLSHASGLAASATIARRKKSTGENKLERFHAGVHSGCVTGRQIRRRRLASAAAHSGRSGGGELLAAAHALPPQRLRGVGVPNSAAVSGTVDEEPSGRLVTAELSQ
mmetsp:Transcript_40080/g.119373  ORF Transcript_40080/g.119373 Transcript_40080/m.119373 type:complete len:331 (+) Transcript_40080:70-1062(+)